MHCCAQVELHPLLAQHKLVGVCHCKGLSPACHCNPPHVRHCIAQVELHPLLAQRKLVGVCYRKGVTSVAHSVLGRKRFDAQEGGSPLMAHPMVQRVAQECGKTPVQVCESVCGWVSGWVPPPF